jgi:hypothetical protein
MSFGKCIERLKCRFRLKGRGHWSIENRFHWVDDVTFDEDRSHVADTTAPTVTIDDLTGDPLTVGWHKVSFSGTAFDDREVVQVVWENNAGGNGLADSTTNWFVERVMLKKGKMS